jgi:hypothetical protein
MSVSGDTGEPYRRRDRDDGAATCSVSTQAEALAKVQEVLASAPFTLGETVALGFCLN